MVCSFGTGLLNGLFRVNVVENWQCCVVIISGALHRIFGDGHAVVDSLRSHLKEVVTWDYFGCVF